MTARSQAHHDFTLERTFPVPVEKVWAAFADKETKRLWFAAESEALSMTAYEEDFRVGGHGMNEGSFHGGPPHRFRSTYTDIVEHERIIYTYDMWIGDTHISTSITTIVFEPARRWHPADADRAGRPPRRPRQRRTARAGHGWAARRPGCDAGGMSTPEITDVPVRDGGIRLGQFLKFVGVADSGADAGALIADGEVLVDGVVETRRGRQLERGAVVEVRRPAGPEAFRVA